MGLIFEKNQKSLKTFLQKSITFKNDFYFFGRVKKIWGPSRSFSTPNFLSVASWKGLFFYCFRSEFDFFWSSAFKVYVKYLLRFSITPPSEKK